MARIVDTDADPQVRTTLASRFTAAGFTVVEQAEAEAHARETLLAYTLIERHTFWTRVDITLRDYHTGLDVELVHDKSGARNDALDQVFERLHGHYGTGFDASEAARMRTQTP